MTYELFIKPACPFCHKVLAYLAKQGIEVSLRDITVDADALKTLMRVGGKRQVPCLLVDGKPLYESDDIIAYFAKQG